jgi:NAD(P)-dependent dehydrogenase (short-subunit alcohol dehydrogenase family)
MGRLDGKVAAVTGGAAGIGEAIVRLFLKEGARVAFADRDGARGSDVAQQIKASGGEVLFVEARMERESEAMAFIRQTVEHFGQLDILVNNAAIRLYHRVTEASEESWDTIWGVNVKGYAFCAKAAIPVLRRTGNGSIVNVASNSAVIASYNAVQYDTTKAAVTGLTRAMARDHAEDGIRVNALCPGPTFTPFHAQRAAAAGKTLKEFREEFGRSTMLKRPATPPEIAACVLFLASDEASYVTGTCLFADGGETSMGSNRALRPSGQEL